MIVQLYRCECGYPLWQRSNHPCVNCNTTRPTAFRLVATNTTPESPMESDLVKNDVSSEAWREVIYADGTVYRIDSPVTLWYRKGGSTLRILDAGGIVHLVPGPGYRGATHRWLPRDAARPVEF